MPDTDNSVTHTAKVRTSRPYLVIPKLIEQPTWGGEYIAMAKGWQDRPELRGRKIGQSYELFSGSNLSLCTSSADPSFMGEIADRDSAQLPSSVSNSIPLAKLVEASAADALGERVAERRDNVDLLIKFTQALGNSFQVHLKDGQTDPYWKPKPESWYFFEPGLITLGVKKDAQWQDYQTAVEAVDAGMRAISEQIKSGQRTYEQAKTEAQSLIQQHDPWQFVNRVEVGKDELIDLSAGGLHHSWEEDTARLPLGNVLYELQTEAMDDVSTLRSFDRGKLAADGALRDVHIRDYFRLIDRSSEANDPATHQRQPQTLSDGDGHVLVGLLRAQHYALDKLTLQVENARYTDKISRFKHLFVKQGSIHVATGSGAVSVGAGHSCFVPAGAGEYTIVCKSSEAEVLLSTVGV